MYPSLFNLTTPSSGGPPLPPRQNQHALARIVSSPGGGAAAEAVDCQTHRRPAVPSAPPLPPTPPLSARPPPLSARPPPSTSRRPRPRTTTRREANSASAAVLSNTDADMERQLSCSVCLELFTDPVLLPCLHSLCKVCVHNLLTSVQPKTFLCPECNQSVHLGPSGVKSLKKNFPLSSIVAIFKQAAGSMERQPPTRPIPKCIICVQSTPFMHCNTCKMTFCKTCFTDFHPTPGESSGHSLVPVVTHPGQGLQPAASDEVSVQRTLHLPGQRLQPAAADEVSVQRTLHLPGQRLQPAASNEVSVQRTLPALQIHPGGVSGVAVIQLDGHSPAPSCDPPLQSTQSWQSTQSPPSVQSLHRPPAQSLFSPLPSMEEQRQSTIPTSTAVSSHVPVQQPHAQVQLQLVNLMELQHHVQSELLSVLQHRHQGI